MDPDATIRLIMEAIRAGDRERFAELCEALREWEESGGFPPDPDLRREAAGRAWDAGF